MPQNQHVIAKWLLELFARPEPGGLTLSVFDKTTGAIGRDVPSRFSTSLDDHSGTIEADLGRIESAGAEPVRPLVARVSAVGPGLWPLAGTMDNLTGTGALVEVASPEPEMRLFRPERWLAEPSADDRARIARYLTLMFTGSPKMERAIAEVSVAVRAGYVAMVTSMAPEWLPQTLGALDETSTKRDSSDFAHPSISPMRSPRWLVRGPRGRRCSVPARRFTGRVDHPSRPRRGFVAATAVAGDIRGMYGAWESHSRSA